MELEHEEPLSPLSPVITTTRRDSGLFVAFNIKRSNNSRRDSGLEINDLDRLRQSRSNDILDRNEKGPAFIPSNNLGLEYRDSGSPIHTHSFNFVPKFVDDKNEENSFSENVDGKDEFRSCHDNTGLTDDIMINGIKENLQENEIIKSYQSHKRDVAKHGSSTSVMNDDIINSPVNSPRMERSLNNLPRMRKDYDSPINSPRTRASISSPINSPRIKGEVNSPVNSPRKRDEIPFKNYKENKVVLRKKQNVKEGEEGTSLLEKKPPRPNSCRPSSSSRATTSSRVETMMKSDLFKKYLSRHEDLIDKISIKQGRGMGLKKALSNLDVSQLDFDEDETEANKKCNLNASYSFNDESLKTAWENSPGMRTRRNTYSEADFNRKSNKENFTNSEIKTNSDAQHQPQISNFLKTRGSNRQKFAIPSFHEFKMSKQFKNIPEEVAGNEDEEEICENCDRNRMCDNEKKKSRSHSRCQRIKEKYSQNHEDLSTLRTSPNSESSISNDMSRLLCNDPHSQSTGNKIVNSEDNEQNLSPRINLTEEKHLIKTVRKSEIPVRIKTSNSGSSLNDENCLHKQGDQNFENPNSGLPPRHFSDRKRVILRASRKRKMGQKNPFVRSQSDSQLKIDSASFLELQQKSKSKPPPLEMRTVHSLESFSEISASSSPMLSAPCHSPSSSVTFDFSADQIVKFGLGQNDDCSDTVDSSQEQINNMLNNGDDIKSGKDNSSANTKISNSDQLGGDNSSDNIQTFNFDKSGKDNCSANFQTSGKDNSSAILQVELWSDNSDKQTISSVSDCSDRNTEELLVHSENSSQTKCILDKMNSFLSQHSLNTEDELLPLDAKSSVTRSTSDVCDTQTSDALKKRRERKERPYKSDPFTGSPYLPAARQRLPTLSKDEVFESEDISLEEVEEEDETSLMSEQDWDRERKLQHRLSDVSSDSGVIGPEYPPSPTGTGFSTSSSTFDTECSMSSTGSNTVSSRIILNTDFNCDARKTGIKSPRSRVSSGCKDCGNFENNNRTNCCSKCEKKSVERKEIILEIKETEDSYGRDLAILKEHFYKPMKSAGLLSMEHLEGIFLNLDELIHVNSQFVKKLQSAVDAAVKKGDENLKTVSIGNLFMDSSSLILAFENYCVNQGQAAVLLEQLEREKELLRIFLQVSQDENPILRRMPLKSFLVVPVQRITRYPLLLERLYKFTSGDHIDKSALMDAKLKIEDILDHINSKTKHGSTIKLKRKISDNVFQRISITEKIEVNKVATEVLGWNRKEVCDIIMCRLQVAALSDQTWAGRRLKTMKFTTVHCVMLTLGQSDADITDVDEDGLLFAKKSKVIQAAVVLIKEKNGKYQTLREPFILNRCVVSVDPEVENAFELSDLNKESYLFKGDDLKELKSFIQTVKQQTLNLGVWRKRRNALPNIMIKHVV